MIIIITIYECIVVYITSTFTAYSFGVMIRSCVITSSRKITWSGIRTRYISIVYFMNINHRGLYNHHTWYPFGVPWTIDRCGLLLQCKLIVHVTPPKSTELSVRLPNRKRNTLRIPKHLLWLIWKQEIFNFMECLECIFQFLFIAFLAIVLPDEK